MADNIIQLPRPKPLRTGAEPLAFFARVGFNDHAELLQLLAAGERGLFGFVVEAQNAAERHKDLLVEARKREMDLVLDPKTHQLGLPGSYTSSLAKLPWAGEGRYQMPSDFAGDAGQAKAARLVEFALKHGFTQILGPTHVLTGPNDIWLRRDIEMMRLMAQEIEKVGQPLGLIYPLTVPIRTMRDDTLRSALLSAAQDAPCDSIWLRVENFGDDATGEKTAAYVRACQDFHARELPLVADHIGGLPALAALAFGSVGGIAHGVTINQSFKASAWRRPPRPSDGFGSSARVYLPLLDMLVKRHVAQVLLESSPRIRSRHQCKDPSCCQHGEREMLTHPARHAMYQRAREIEKLSVTPPALRRSQFVDHVRQVSDETAQLAAFEKLPAVLKRPLAEKQKKMGAFREAMVHLEKSLTTESEAIRPLRKGVGK